MAASGDELIWTKLTRLLRRESCESSLGKSSFCTNSLLFCTKRTLRVAATNSKWAMPSCWLRRGSPSTARDSELEVKLGSPLLSKSGRES